VVPPDEVDKVAEFLYNLLHCKMEALPTEFFRHKYWVRMTGAFQTKQKPYSKCLKSLGAAPFQCSDILRAACPARLGEDWEMLLGCKQSILDKSNEEDFLRYQLCNSESQRTMQPCAEMLARNCSSAAMRVTKTVRATMASARLLLERDQNVRIINLVRDPRAVVLSRMSFFSTRGAFSKNNRILEAKIFCRSVTQDFREFYQLQELYHGRMIQVVYDDFVKDPEEYATAIYEFLEEEAPEQTMQWLAKNTKGKRNSTTIADRWQARLPYAEVKIINELCSEYMAAIAYPWP
jgi:hypothetical protein